MLSKEDIENAIFSFTNTISSTKEEVNRMSKSVIDNLDIMKYTFKAITDNLRDSQAALDESMARFNAEFTRVEELEAALEEANRSRENAESIALDKTKKEIEWVPFTFEKLKELDIDQIIKYNPDKLDEYDNNAHGLPHKIKFISSHEDILDRFFVLSEINEEVGEDFLVTADDMQNHGLYCVNKALVLECD